MRRREFIKFVSGAAAAWPLAVDAQQQEQVRRIGVLMAIAESDQESQARMAVFREQLGKLGWTEGRDVRIDYRWGAGDTSRLPELARELIELRPEVIVAAGLSAATAARQQTLSIPIVFLQVSDPVAAGFVTSLARPEGNITGFTNFEFSIGGKWLEVVKECVPAVSRIAVLFEPANQSWIQYLRTIEAAAPSFGVRLTPAGVRNPAEIERHVAAFSREPNGGLIVLPGPITSSQRERIISLAAKYRLPAIYPYRFFVAGGGLLSYGIDTRDLYRRTASYVDRILRGAKPRDLPIEQPTKFQLVINLKAAKALGLTVPPALLVRADEVIE